MTIFGFTNKNRSIKKKIRKITELVPSSKIAKIAHENRLAEIRNEEYKFSIVKAYSKTTLKQMTSHREFRLNDWEQKYDNLGNLNQT